MGSAAQLHCATIHVAGGTGQWAIPLLYTPTDDNKWCPGGWSLANELDVCSLILIAQLDPILRFEKNSMN